MPKEKDELARQEELSIMAGNLEKYKKFCVMYADLHLGTFPMKKKEKYDKSSTHIKSKIFHRKDAKTARKTQKHWVKLKVSCHVFIVVSNFLCVLCVFAVQRF